MVADLGAQAVGVSDRGHDLVAGVLEQPPEPFAQQRLVLRDHDPHGSSAVTTVPRPGGLATDTLPPSAATRSVIPASPEPGEGTAPPTPSSRTETTRLPFCRAAITATLDACACFAALVKCLAGDEVGGSLDAVLEALVGRLDARSQARSRREIAQRRGQAVVEPCRTHAACELAQLLDRPRQLGDRGVERRRLRAGRRELSLEVAQPEPDRHEPLLRPIVKVTLQPAALLVSGRDDAGSRFLDLGKLPAHLGPQTGDLDREPGGADDALQQVGALAERLVVHDGRERERPAPHRRAGPAVARTIPSTTRPDTSTWTSPAGSQKSSSSPGSPSACASISPVASGAARPARRSSR